MRMTARLIDGYLLKLTKLSDWGAFRLRVHAVCMNLCVCIHVCIVLPCSQSTDH